MTAVITMPLDPVLQLGPLPLHWYGLMYAVAFYVGWRFAAPHFYGRGISHKDAGDLLFWTIVFGLVGARLFFVLQQPNLVDYLSHPVRVIAVWEGGMAFFGAIIASAATLAVICYRRGLPLWVIFDGGAIFATIGQAVGRIGNIINGDILGPPSQLPWAIRYNGENFGHLAGVGYQPAGAYEMLVSLALFGMVMLLLSRRPPDGTAVIFYIGAYAVSQFLLFFVRATEPTILLGLKQAQVTSLVMLLVAVPVLVALRRRYPRVWATEAAVTGGEGPDQAAPGTTPVLQQARTDSG